MTVQIDVFADVVCPWCYIGERRLRHALENVRREHRDWDVVLRWRPFQLQPDMPSGGLPWRAFAEAKFGGWARAEAAFRHVASVAREEGLSFHFDRIAGAPNTVDAHRLILFARSREREWQMAEALFAAYFTHGRDLNDVDHLVQVAEQVGLPSEDVRRYLASDRGAEEVAASQELAARLGIRGVPFFVFDGRYAVSGAQPADILAEALRTVVAEPFTSS